MNSYSVTQIGVIRTSFQTLEDCPRGGADDARLCRIDLLPTVFEGLKGIEAASHLWVLYWLEQADRKCLTRLTLYDGVNRGVFANRSPARPNPIAIRAVRLFGFAQGPVGQTLIIGGMDCVDGTPLLDLKPYVPAADCILDAQLAWFRN